MKAIETSRYAWSGCGWVSMGALLLALTLGGCAANERKGEAMTPQATKQSDQEIVPEGYPYSPAELWRRILQVLKSPPENLGYREFGKIWDLEFDEEKIKWYGNDATKKYFLAGKPDIKSPFFFPFNVISLGQSEPYFNKQMLKLERRVSFSIDLFTRLGPEIQSQNFCLYPKISEIESLGYTRVPDNDWPPPVPDYKTYEFSSDIRKIRPKKIIMLHILHNGCLFGIDYFGWTVFSVYYNDKNEG